MPSGPRLLINNACYHIITRGNQRQTIFRNQSDYHNYLLRLKKYKIRYNLFIFGYCLMPNHIHIIGEINNPIHLSSFMHDLNRSYTAYFNTKYKKVGYLWQGRFKSKIVSKDRYLIDCVNYIETNPVRAKLVNSSAEYLYSSYRQRVLGLAEIRGILNEIAL